MFQGVSGDNEPIQCNIEFLNKKGHKNLPPHGMQVMSQKAAGA